MMALCDVFVSADVYSYDEDDMVLDPKLPEHLSHFGIDMMTMEKVRSSQKSLLKLLKKLFFLVFPSLFVRRKEP